MEPAVQQLAEVFARTVANDRVREGGGSRQSLALPTPPAASRGPARPRVPSRIAKNRVADAMQPAAPPLGPQEAIKAAEEQLKSVSQQPGFGITVLKVRASRCKGNG